MNNELRDFLQERLKNNHFIQYMGLQLDEVETGSAQMSIHIQNHHLQQNGFTHGGVTATLCDVVTGIAAYSTVNKEKNVVTADLKISYLNPSTAPRIFAVGKVKKAGKFLIFCEAEVFDDRGEDPPFLVATCTAIMAAVDIPVITPTT